jgi:hypothetical protein
MGMETDGVRDEVEALALGRGLDCIPIGAVAVWDVAFASKKGMGVGTPMFVAPGVVGAVVVLAAARLTAAVGTEDERTLSTLLEGTCGPERVTFELFVDIPGLERNMGEETEEDIVVRL